MAGAGPTAWRLQWTHLPDGVCWQRHEEAGGNGVVHHGETAVSISKPVDEVIHVRQGAGRTEQSQREGGTEGTQESMWEEAQCMP